MCVGTLEPQRDPARTELGERYQERERIEYKARTRAWREWDRERQRYRRVGNRWPYVSNARKAWPTSYATTRPRQSSRSLRGPSAQVGLCDCDVGWASYENNASGSDALTTSYVVCIGAP